MKEYVIALLIDRLGQFLFILKDRPEWQKGKLNLPGGRVEEGEMPEQAVVREIYEETGIKVNSVFNRGMVKDRNVLIHCFYALAVLTPKFVCKPREGETEQCLWIDPFEAYRDKRLIPNLRVIIPLLMSGQEGWVIEDNTEKPHEHDHTLTISVPTYKD